MTAPQPDLTAIRAGVEWLSNTLPWRIADSVPDPSIRSRAGWEIASASYPDGHHTLAAIVEMVNALPELLAVVDRLTAERDEARDEASSLDVTIVEMNKALTRVEAERDALREELARARHDLLVMDAARSPFAHSAALVEHLALAIRARERTPRQIADEEIERGYHNALNGYREVARAILRDFDKALAAVVPAPAASSVDGPIAILQLAGHGYTGHGHRCCKQAPTDQQPSPAANCGGPKRCEPCSDDVDDIHARSEAPAAIWCRRCNTLIGPEKLDDHNREHHVPAASEPFDLPGLPSASTVDPRAAESLTPQFRISETAGQGDAHIYLSTYCYHGTHDECGAAQHDRGDLSAPHCKGCPAPCICPRHLDPDAPCWGGDQPRRHDPSCALDADHLGWCGPLRANAVIPLMHAIATWYGTRSTPAAAKGNLALAWEEYTDAVGICEFCTRPRCPECLVCPRCAGDGHSESCSQPDLPAEADREVTRARCPYCCVSNDGRSIEVRHGGYVRHLTGSGGQCSGSYKSTAELPPLAEADREVTP